MQGEALSVAVIVVGGIVLANVVGELIKLFFQRMRTSDYITKTDCQNCKKKHDDDDEDLVKQIKAIRKLLVKVAITNGVKSEDIEEVVD